jgi:alditol oxidase
MKRKTFLQTSSVLAAGSMVLPLASCNDRPRAVRKNWAGNYQYKAENLHQPKTVEELQVLVKKLDKQKALGSCHCFNDIADSPFNQISTQNLNKIVAINEQANTLTVEAGARYGQFAPELHERGYALHNLASLPHISVAGACSTATHGSGVKNGNLASAVAGLEFVTANGDIVNLTREKDAEQFNGAVVGLGALGIITKLTLDIQKTYQVRQDLYQDLPLQSLKDHFGAILESGYSVSLFTDWQNKNISQIWIKRRVEPDTKNLGIDFYGAKAAAKNLHPITKLSAENCTEQMGVAGAWYERLPHFKMGFTPSSGEELQSEFFVPRENALDAILALEKKGAEIFPELMISEIRTIDADNYWMSPCYKRPCVAIHFTWKQHPAEVTKLIAMIEAELAPYEARPHWGKLFTMAPSVLHSRYEKLPDFLQLLKTYDPKGKFRNKYLDLNICTA